MILNFCLLTIKALDLELDKTQELNNDINKFETKRNVGNFYFKDLIRHRIKNNEFTELESEEGKLR